MVQSFSVVIVIAEYPSAAALHVEVETQLGLGGLILDVGGPAAIGVGDALTLRISVLGASIDLPATVGEKMADELCLEIDDAAVALLRAAPMLAGSHAPCAAVAPLVRFELPDSGDPPDSPAPLDTEDSAHPTAAERVKPLERRLAAMSVGEKIQMALHGARDWRQILARDRAGVVQSALIRNPRLSLDEATALARSATLAPDAAEAIAQHPSFGSSAQIALALVRNSRTPIPAATQMVARLSPTDLRTVAKGLGVRAPIAAAARKRLLNEQR